MPTQHYSRIPDDDPDDLNRLNRSYYTGLPTLSTAPPSFHFVALSNDNLPHRNDETAATVMPPSLYPRAEDNITDPAISLYAPSDSALDLEATREDTFAELKDQVESFQERVEEQILTIKDRVKDFEEGITAHVGRSISTAHWIVQKIGAGFLGLWILCIIGVVLYFTRP